MGQQTMLVEFKGVCYEIQNLIENGKINNVFYENFLVEIDRIQSSLDKLKKNYSLKRLNLDKHLTFDLLVEPSSRKILAFCGVYNGGRYPKGVYRYMNRSYISPELRGRPLGIISGTLLPYHLEKCYSDTKMAFISREGCRAQLYFKRWLKHYAPKLQSWYMSSCFVQVVPGGKTKSCYQYIVYNLAQPIWQWRTINRNEWEKLPD